VGFDDPRLALMLIAVEPRLQGIIFVGPPGSGKSAIMHGFAELLPDVPLVQLPIGCDADMLLGGLDLEATLHSGKRVVRPGALVRANGGVLLVDGCNLMGEGADTVVLGALEDGQVRLEREGVSERSPAKFTMIAAYDPGEGSPRAHLLDRVGLLVTMPAITATAARVEIVRRHLGGVDPDWEEEAELMRALIATARDALPDIVISAEDQEQLIAIALSLGIEGHRADLFAVLAAKASAALGLRDVVEREDVDLAIRLVLMPRATRFPEPPAPPSSPQAEAESEPDDAPTESDPDDGLPDESNLELTEDILDALATALPLDLGSLPFAQSRGGKTGSRGSTNGKRGRHVASVPGHLTGNKIDVIATLRAAAPWQKLRARRQDHIAIRADDIRIKRYKSKAGALFLFAVDASGSMALNRMREAKGAVHALLEQAYVNRDRVALISFRGQSADLLLPPTGSVELLRRAVDRIPTGGGTPLAATLTLAIDVADQARRKGFQNIILVLLTDGRANIGLRAGREDVDAELKQMAQTTAAFGIKSILIDTQRSFLDHRAGENLAGWLGGTYLYLPNAKSSAIADAARQAA
jgi:magnesium chelatase subunit D